MQTQRKEKFSASFGRSLDGILIIVGQWVLYRGNWVHAIDAFPSAFFTLADTDKMVLRPDEPLKSPVRCLGKLVSSSNGAVVYELDPTSLSRLGVLRQSFMLVSEKTRKTVTEMNQFEMVRGHLLRIVHSALTVFFLFLFSESGLTEEPGQFASYHI